MVKSDGCAAMSDQSPTIDGAVDLVERYLGTFLRWVTEHNPNDAIAKNARRAAELMVEAALEKPR